MNARDIKPGTPCYLVNLKEMKELVGRVVTVRAGPMFCPDQDHDWFYSLEASWASERFPNASMMLAPRHHLLPIAPPELEPKAIKRSEEPAHR